MAAGGGPTPDQWEKMSRKQKIVYGAFVGVVVAIIGVLLIKRFLL